MTPPTPTASIVIPFRDWGQSRLAMCISSIHQAFGDMPHDVVVSDYGSADEQGNRRIAEAEEAQHVYTDCGGDEPWSRSRALNIGFAHARGSVLMCTDADMIFTPNSLARVADIVLRHPNTTALIECRDLPAGWDDAHIRASGYDWTTYERVSKFRGRWGMGGLIALSSDTFDRVRGLDERMHTYGAEDLDFGQRSQWAGNRVLWVDDPDVRMFHMWHPSEDRRSHEDPEFKAIVDFNRDILWNDTSVTRNSVAWRASARDSRPLVSVTITTRDRPAMLRDALNSVLAQTVQDFEIVVVDDGSVTRDAERVVESFNDNRIRYFYQSAAGIPSAHNKAILKSRGHWIANLDDDDLMPPWRLETQIAAITKGALGAYGAFVNFVDETGELKIFHERQASLATVFKRGGAPGHSTWMFAKELLDHVGYDEALVSGEDNDLFLRLIRSGVRVRHCGEIAALRRRHSSQTTVTDNREHERVATFNRFRLRFNAHHALRAAVEKAGEGHAWVTVRGSEDVEATVRPYLPDHLAGPRILSFQDDVGPEVLSLLEDPNTLDVAKVVDARSGVTLTTKVVTKGPVTLADMARLRTAGYSFSVATQQTGVARGVTETGRDVVRDLVEEHRVALGSSAACVVTQSLDRAEVEGLVGSVASLWKYESDRPNLYFGVLAFRDHRLALEEAGRLSQSVNGRTSVAVQCESLASLFDPVRPSEPSESVSGGVL